MDGTSRDYAIDRLKRQAPQFHAMVVAGEMSAHAAMVAAGLREPRFTITGQRPGSIARALRLNLTPEVLQEVARLIA